MDRDRYVATVRDLLSRDPARVREANRTLYTCLVNPGSAKLPDSPNPGVHREADLVLAEVAE